MNKILWCFFVAPNIHNCSHRFNFIRLWFLFQITVHTAFSGFLGSSKTRPLNAVCPLNAVASTKCGCSRISHTICTFWYTIKFCFLFWEVFLMGIFIPTKLSSIRHNFAFNFWKYFERIFDSNVLIHSDISRENVWNEEKTSPADNGRKAMACQSSWKKSKNYTS